MLERVEVVEATGVLPRDHLDLVVGNLDRLQRLPNVFGRVRPRAVGVRVVTLPGDVLDTDVVAQPEAGVVVDEAGEDALLEDLAGELVAEVLQRPRAVTLVRVVRALEPVGNPADTARPANFTVGTCAAPATRAVSEQNTPVLNGMVWMSTSNGERGMKLARSRSGTQ